MWLDLFKVNIFLRLTVKILSFLRLTAKFWPFFVDGTVRPIARPDNYQGIVYNSNERVHAPQFQSLALPNGTIGHLYGPVGTSVLEVSLSC